MGERQRDARCQSTAIKPATQLLVFARTCNRLMLSVVPKWSSLFRPNPVRLRGSTDFRNDTGIRVRAPPCIHIHAEYPQHIGREILVYSHLCQNSRFGRDRGLLTILLLDRFLCIPITASLDTCMRNIFMLARFLAGAGISFRVTTATTGVFLT